jgi:hypothetical protein
MNSTIGIVVVALAAVIWLPLAPDAAGVGLAPERSTGDVVRGPIPYELDQRPMPQGQDAEVLLPRQVGTFVRRPFARGTKVGTDEDLNADYTNGRDTINVGVSLTEKREDAKQAVKMVRQQAIDQVRRDGGRKPSEASGALESLESDPSFYKFEDLLAWSRGEYFFYAKANSAGALDRFMSSFPF